MKTLEDLLLRLYGLDYTLNQGFTESQEERWKLVADYWETKYRISEIIINNLKQKNK